MLSTLLSIVAAIIGISSGIITILQFLKKAAKPKPLLIVVTLVFSTVAVTVGYLLNEEKYKEEIAQIKEESIRKDAATTNSGIIITGGGDFGEYVGYLTHITGFYASHRDRFQIEYDNYSRQLAEWQDHLKRMRESGKYVYSSDLEGLKGLVTSGSDHLRKIGSSK